MRHCGEMTINKVLFLVIVATLFCIGCFGDEMKDNNGDIKNNVSNNKTDLKSSNLNHQATTKGHLDNAVTTSDLEGPTIHPKEELHEHLNTKKNKREDNYCFPKFQNVNTVSKNFEGDEIKRIVIYFYIVRDKVGNVKEFMYIPDVNKQHQLPDLPSQNNDLIINAKYLTVKDILNDDNPFIINDNEFSSVPDQRENKIMERSKIDHFRNKLPINCYDTDKGIICKNERGDIIQRGSVKAPNQKDDKLQVDVTKEPAISDEDRFSSKPGYDEDEILKLIKYYMTKIIKEKESKSKTVFEYSELNKHSSTESFNMMSDNDDSKIVEDGDSNETELDIFENNSDETFQTNKQLQPKHPKIYDKWVHYQILANGKKFKKNRHLNIKLLKDDIIKGLSENGFIINKKGQLIDQNGHSYNMANVKLIPIFNSKTEYNIKQRKQVKYIVVVSQRPFRILTTIPINNKHKKHRKTKSKYSLLDSSEEEQGLDYQDTQLPSKHRTKCVHGCIQRRCRGKRSSPFPYDDILKNAIPCPACRFRMDNAPEKKEKDITDILVRILGGSAAMGSGRPIRNKGRNNVVSEDSNEK